jgi:glutamyl-tRNA synthetase
MPQFAHLPLLLKPDGNGKLSKRDAEKHGFPIFPLAWKDPNMVDGADPVDGFREQGYLPEALVNFLAFLGWNPGTNQEMFTKNELIEAFSLERIGKSGTKFDIVKAKWFNQQYYRLKSDEELASLIRPKLEERGFIADAARLTTIAGLIKDRITFLDDYWQEGHYFFEAPSSYDEQVAAKRWNTDVIRTLEAYAEVLMGRDSISAAEAKEILQTVLEEFGLGIGKVMQGVRLAITGVGAGADLMEIISILGPKEVVSRINRAKETLKQEA